MKKKMWIGLIIGIISLIVFAPFSQAAFSSSRVAKAQIKRRPTTILQEFFTNTFSILRMSIFTSSSEAMCTAKPDKDGCPSGTYVSVDGHTFKSEEDAYHWTKYTSVANRSA